MSNYIYFAGEALNLDKIHQLYFCVQPVQSRTSSDGFTYHWRGHLKGVMRYATALDDDQKPIWSETWTLYIHEKEQFDKFARDCDRIAQKLGCPELHRFTWDEVQELAVKDEQQCDVLSPRTHSIVK